MSSQSDSPVLTFLPEAVDRSPSTRLIPTSILPPPERNLSSFANVAGGIVSLGARITSVLRLAGISVESFKVTGLTSYIIASCCESWGMACMVGSPLPCKNPTCVFSFNVIFLIFEDKSYSIAVPGCIRGITSFFSPY